MKGEPQPEARRAEMEKGEPQPEARRAEMEKGEPRPQARRAEMEKGEPQPEARRAEMGIPASAASPVAPCARLMIAASESDANLYYAARFLAPDPSVYLEVAGRKVLLMSDLEVDRARAQARVDEVLSLSEWEAKAGHRWAEPHLADTVRAREEIGTRSPVGGVWGRSGGRSPPLRLSLLLDGYGAREVTVPADFALELADRLRERGVTVRARPHPGAAGVVEAGPDRPPRAGRRDLGRAV